MKKVMASFLVSVAIGLTAAGPTDASGRGGGGHHGSWGGHHGHRGHHHHGFHGRGRAPVIVGFGSAFWWGYPWGYSYPYPYPSTVVVEPAPAYSEQVAPHFWYYCHSAGAYYPYVHACPEGWVRVSPRAP